MKARGHNISAHRQEDIKFQPSPHLEALAVLSSALGVVLVEDRAHRVGAYDLEVRVLPLEVAPDARNSAARRGCREEVSDLAFRLLPDLGRNRVVVRVGVEGVAVLVDAEPAVVLFTQALLDVLERGPGSGPGATGSGATGRGMNVSKRVGKRPRKPVVPAAIYFSLAVRPTW